MAHEVRKPILVIGHGNDLHSDDGAGRWVPDQIEAMELPNVEVLSIMQLTPEIALDIVDRDLVIFVDASVDTDELRIEDIRPNHDATVMTHHGDPSSLLSLGIGFGRSASKCLLVSVPGPSLG